MISCETNKKNCYICACGPTHAAHLHAFLQNRKNKRALVEEGKAYILILTTDDAFCTGPAGFTVGPLDTITHAV